MRHSQWTPQFEEYAQACRAYQPSKLIAAVGRISAALGEPLYADEVTRSCLPWGLAATARESLLYGDESSKSRCLQRDVQRLVEKFNESDVPRGSPSEPGFLLSIVTPIHYEQFP